MPQPERFTDAHAFSRGQPAVGAPIWELSLCS